ncbi:MAG: YfdX family protein [Gammaproteobacteria bacterium]|jgi:hypothetical protein
MLTYTLKPVAAAVLVATLGAGAILNTANAAIKEQVSVSPVKTISAQEEQTISSAATKVLRHIAQARADLKNKDAEAAKTQLDKAETLFKIIEVSMPVNKVKDRIWVAKKHLEYEDSQEVIPDLVPIYSSLDELVDFMPVEQAKQHLDKAKEHLKQKNKQKAIEELDETDAALVYTEIDLPLKITRQRVASAQADIAKGNLEQAGKTLKAAEESVSFMSVDVDEPLTVAKSSLWSAIRNYSAHAYDKTKTDLERAIKYLQTAAQSADETTRSEAAKLVKEAKALEDKVQSHSTETAKRLDHLWHHTAALSERSLEYMSAGWSSLRADSKIKTDLIDAKLHVSNAQIDRFTDDNVKEAKSELDNALSYLGRAADKAGDSHKTQVKQLQRDVQKLAQAVSESADNQPQYTQIKQQMTQLIDTL